ncbi:MAG: hypothetical protein OEZ58_05860 [Gammaproteobacteria bacterium]|nr:hypothetical protein [Gammaproteobacteria bacterium]
MSLKSSEYLIVQDKKGMVWDLILYIPTLIILALVASQLWYSGNQSFTYLLIFLTTFIFLIAFNRIFKTRLMLLASAPVKLVVSKKAVHLNLKNGDAIDLVKDVRFFADFAGKSFGLVGLDMSGKRKQFVFHKGQFESQSAFDTIKSELRIFK